MIHRKQPRRHRIHLLTAMIVAQAIVAPSPAMAAEAEPTSPVASVNGLLPTQFDEALSSGYDLATTAPERLADDPLMADGRAAVPDVPSAAPTPRRAAYRFQDAPLPEDGALAVVVVAASLSTRDNDTALPAVLRLDHPGAQPDLQLVRDVRVRPYVFTVPAAELESGLAVVTVDVWAPTAELATTIQGVQLDAIRVHTASTVGASTTLDAIADLVGGACSELDDCDVADTADQLVAEIAALVAPCDGEPAGLSIGGDCITPPSITTCQTGVSINDECISLNSPPEINPCTGPDGAIGVDITGVGCTTVPLEAIPDAGPCSDEGIPGLQIDDGPCIAPPPPPSIEPCSDPAGTPGLHVEGNGCIALPLDQIPQIGTCGEETAAGLLIDGTCHTAPPPPSVQPCTDGLGNLGVDVEGVGCTTVPLHLLPDAGPCTSNGMPGLEVGQGACTAPPPPPTIALCNDSDDNPGLFVGGQGCTSIPLDAIPSVALCTRDGMRGLRIDGGDCTAPPPPPDVDLCDNYLGDPGIYIEGSGCTTIPVNLLVQLANVAAGLIVNTANGAINTVTDAVPDVGTCSQGGMTGASVDGTCHAPPALTTCSGDHAEPGLRLGDGACNVVPVPRIEYCYSDLGIAVGDTCRGLINGSTIGLLEDFVDDPEGTATWILVTVGESLLEDLGALQEQLEDPPCPRNLVVCR